MAESESPIPTPPPPPAPPPAVEAADPAPITAAAAAHLFAVGRAPSHSAPVAWEAPAIEELQCALPQYEIRALIGRGGMGAVYRGVQRSLDREVAIKILPPEVMAGDPQFAVRFQHEARAMARLTHPGIVTVHEAGETAEGLLYFVMEYVEGTDVQAMLTERGLLPPEEALPIVARVCEALEFAHESGFIHRDIKPANVMIDRRGQVKVADFGLARMATEAGFGLTGSKLLIGTAEFVAPEAFRPGVELDRRADVYAVGVMLYQMLTGTLPRGRFELPSRCVAGLDERLDAIVDRAMQSNREWRYPTAHELRADIHRILGVGPGPSGPFVAAAHAPPAKPAPRARGKVRIWLAVASIVVLTAGGVGWWSRGGGRRVPGPSAPPAVFAPRWRDAFAESPLKEVIARAERTAHGFRMPAHNHWTISPGPHRSGALRIRATGKGEKFASLQVVHEDRKVERIRYLSRTGEWVLSHGPRGPGEIDLAAAPGASPLDGQSHELILARVGGRLRAMLDGRLLLDEGDPSSEPGTFVLDLYPEADVSVEKVEYLDLDEVPDAVAQEFLSLEKR